MRINLADHERPDPFKLRLPFLREATGLGDAVARITEAVGIPSCQPCKERQEKMNQAVQFNPWST